MAGDVAGNFTIIPAIDAKWTKTVTDALWICLICRRADVLDDDLVRSGRHSRTDTFRNVVLEALASGVPCVVSHCHQPGYGDFELLVVDGDIAGFAVFYDELRSAVVRARFQNAQLQIAKQIRS